VEREEVEVYGDEWRERRCTGGVDVDDSLGELGKAVLGHDLLPFLGIDEREVGLHEAALGAHRSEVLVDDHVREGGDGVGVSSSLVDEREVGPRLVGSGVDGVLGGVDDTSGGGLPGDVVAGKVPDHDFGEG
jgi:hypothetical protein